MRHPDKLTMWLLRVGAAVLAVGALAMLGWAFLTMKGRLYDGVEGEIVFEASRVREGLALYTDPVVGTDDVPPSRYYVLYPPFWSALLSLVPAASVRVVARLLATACFLGAIAFAARKSRVAWLGGLFAVAFTPFLLFGASARPDAIAVFCAAIAFDRVLRKGQLDEWAGVLFALGLLFKPNVMGMALGVFGLSSLRAPLATIKPIAFGVATGSVGAIALGIASHGMFVDHVLRSTAQPPSLSLWIGQVTSRLPFVAFPLGVAVLYAWPVRKKAEVSLAIAALGASVTWALLSLSKTGSASNYWMEPALSAIGLVRVAEARRAELETSPWSVQIARIVAALVVVQSVHNGVASVRNAGEEIALSDARREVVERIRKICVAERGHVIAADQDGVEVELNGRLLSTPYQMLHLFMSGKLPREPWIADLDQPAVRCFVSLRDEIERKEPYPIEDRRLDPAIVAAIRERFILDASFAPHALLKQSGMYLYVRPIK